MAAPESGTTGFYKVLKSRTHHLDRGRRLCVQPEPGRLALPLLGVHGGHGRPVRVASEGRTHPRGLGGDGRMRRTVFVCTHWLRWRRGADSWELLERFCYDCAAFYNDNHRALRAAERTHPEARLLFEVDRSEWVARTVLEKVIAAAEKEKEGQQ